ncbi:porin family protein [Chryseolinea soli]|nr:porin family protein [Chryseolinea soli]
MNKFLLTFFLTLAACTLSHGQAAILVMIFGDKVASENFNFSLIGGFNVCNVTNYPGGKAILGAHFGLGANIRLGKSWYLIPEFKPFSYKGFQSTESLVTGDPAIDEAFHEVKTLWRSKYMEFPVLLHYRPTNRWQFGLGPQVNFLTGAKRIYEGSPGTFTKNSEDQFHEVDWGMAVNATYRLSTQRDGKGINIQARYYRGFSYVLLNGDNNVNSVFSLSLEFPFIKGNDDEKSEKGK